MEISGVLKFIGILVTTISAVAAIFGDSRENGKFTTYGWVLVTCISIGFLTSLALEVYEQIESEKKALIEQKTARIEQEWELIKSEKIDFMGVEFYSTGQAKIEDFVGFTNLIKITLEDARSSYKDSLLFKFQVEKRRNNNINNLVRLVAYPTNLNPIVSRQNTELFTLEIRNSELRGIFDFNRKTLNRDSKICGIFSKISWKDIKLEGILRLEDLIYLNITFDSPYSTNFPVELIGNYDPGFFFGAQIEIPSFTFDLYDTMVHFVEVENEKGIKRLTKTIKGRDLLDLFKKEFFEIRLASGDSLKDDYKLKEATGKITNLQHVIHFGNL